MAKKPSKSLFDQYAEELRGKNRFFPDNKYCRLFDLIINNPYNHKVLQKGTILFRARANNLHRPFTKASEIGINKANPSVNRASPLGIPYMYLAEEAETAIAEIRANVNQVVTVGQFKTRRRLSFLTLNSAVSYYEVNTEEFEPIEVAAFILGLGFAFAKPVSVSAELDYLPCQYFAEYCKQKGLAGIRYISAAKGFQFDNRQNHYNYVLFDEHNVEFSTAHEYIVKGISYDIKLHQQVCLDTKDEGET